MVSDAHLVHMLSIQYDLKLCPLSEALTAQAKCRGLLRDKTNKWLDRQGVYAVAVNIETREVTLVIDDPTNEMLLKKILRYFSNRPVSFMLMDKTRVRMEDLKVI